MKAETPPETTLTTQAVDPKQGIGSRKVPLHLYPAAGVIAGAMAMWCGAEKYGAYNWRGKKLSHTTYLNAARRHLDAILDGEVFAPDGVMHWGHVIACGGIAMDAQASGNLVNDLPLPGPAAAMQEAFVEFLATYEDALNEGENKSEAFRRAQEAFDMELLNSSP
jgi:hypothetical protein